MMTGSGVTRRQDVGAEADMQIARTTGIPCSLPASMKIPRARQDAHIARMADFLGRVVRVLATVVV